MRITGLLYVGLQVPSMEIADTFYSDFGLERVGGDHTTAFRCLGRDQDQVVLSEGPDKRLRYIAFSVVAGTLAEAALELQSRGIILGDGPPEARPGGIWFQDPELTWVNLREEEPAQYRKFEDEAEYNIGNDYRRIDKARWSQVQQIEAQPRRLGHTLFFSSDVFGMERFYVDNLGLRVSDRIAGRASFLNCGPGDHHVFGFLPSTHRGLHHLSFEVSGIDEMSMGAQRMADRGHEMAWGLGRHTVGSNLFHYVRDPWGSWSEYFTDMDQISESWQPGEFAVPSAVWCPLLPPEFRQNPEPAP
jgi:catechol-2,3-dioxygenase